MTVVDDHITLARAMKDELVARTTPPQNDDLCPIVEGWVNGKAKYVVNCHEVDRDLGLAAARILVSGFGCDELWLFLDAHYSKQPLNPRTGRPWGPREMQGLCDDEGACDLGIITDCIFIINKTATSTRFASVPYHVHKTDRSVAWIEDQIETMSDEDDGVKTAGLVADELAAAFELPKVKDVLLDSGVLGPGEVLRAGEFARRASLRALENVGILLVAKDI